MRLTERARVLSSPNFVGSDCPVTRGAVELLAARVAGGVAVRDAENPGAGGAGSSEESEEEECEICEGFF